jgi:hypothetical protein
MTDERGNSTEILLAHNNIPGTWPVFESWLASLSRVQEAPGSNFVVHEQLSRLKSSTVLSCYQFLREVP